MCSSVWACVVSGVFEHARGRVGAFPCLRRNSDTGTLCVEQLSSSALTPIVARLQKSGPRKAGGGGWGWGAAASEGLLRAAIKV